MCATIVLVIVTGVTKGRDRGKKRRESDRKGENERERDRKRENERERERSKGRERERLSERERGAKDRIILIISKGTVKIEACKYTLIISKGIVLDNGFMVLSLIQLFTKEYRPIEQRKFSTFFWKIEMTDRRIDK